MPRIYLSPSTQEFNPYAGGGNEELYMNLIADAMEPFLLSCGIQFSRNTPEMNAAQSIVQSNAGNYDLHLALHSNASPDQLSGQLQGPIVFYSPNDPEGQRASTIIANNLDEIYPYSTPARAEATTSIGEVTQTRAPAAFIELAYHDNAQDAAWIRNNVELIAENIVVSLCDFFGIPFIQPGPIRTGTVDSDGAFLNIRTRPSITSYSKGGIPDGATVTIYGRTGDWYVVEYNGIVGYANEEYIDED